MNYQVMRKTRHRKPELINKGKRKLIKEQNTRRPASAVSLQASTAKLMTNTVSLDYI